MKVSYGPILLSLALCSGCEHNSSAATRRNTAPVSETIHASKELPSPSRVKVAKSDELKSDYSPFVVDVQSDELPFDQMSFKNVGMNLEREERQFVYELVAKSVRDAFSEHDIDARASRDEHWSKPEHHVACGDKHIYADMWHATNASEWGFSLWSGCGEASEFARGQVRAGSDPVGAVEPLARAIVGKIITAIETKCFSRQC